MRTTHINNAYINPSTPRPYTTIEQEMKSTQGVIYAFLLTSSPPIGGLRERLLALRTAESRNPLGESAQLWHLPRSAFHCPTFLHKKMHKLKDSEKTTKTTTTTTTPTTKQKQKSQPKQKGLTGIKRSKWPPPSL